MNTRTIESLNFFGEITASVTHELNNVLGTIEQISGLMEDMAQTDLASNPDASARLMNVVERIGKQSERGSQLIGRLNAFAHLTDRDVCECSLGPTISTIVALSERKVRMHKATIIGDGLSQEIVVTTRPFALVNLIYCVLKTALGLNEAIESVTVALKPSGEGAQIEISMNGQARENLHILDEALTAYASGIHIEVSERVSGTDRVVSLAVPERM